jgi:hypothetical protein
MSAPAPRPPTSGAAPSRQTPPPIQPLEPGQLADAMAAAARAEAAESAAVTHAMTSRS